MDSGCARMTSLVTVLGNLFIDVSSIYTCIYISVKI